MPKYKNRDYTPEEIQTVRELLERYRSYRGPQSGRLSLKELEAKMKRESLHHRADLSWRPYLSRLCDPDQPFPAFRPEDALALHTILGFGEIRDVERDRERIDPRDYDQWVKVTHLQELGDRIEKSRLDAQAHSILARLLKAARASPDAIGGTVAWGTSRINQLHFEYDLALERGKKARDLAEKHLAPPALLALIHYDLSGALTATGDFPQAKGELARSVAIYEQLMGSKHGNRPNIWVGFARTKSRALQIAVWEGKDESACLALYREGEEAMKMKNPDKPALWDHYGLYQINYCMATFHLLEDRHDKAKPYVGRTREHAQAVRPWPGFPDPRWFDPLLLIRDGGLFGGNWCKLHAYALSADYAVLSEQWALVPEQEDPTRIKEAVGFLLLIVTELTGHRWAQPIPPLVPYYSWKIELLEDLRTHNELRQGLEERVDRACAHDYVLYVPLSLVALGDFRRQVEHDDRSARDAYKRAHALAVHHGFARLAAFAHRRLAS